ncbi:MAG: ATP-binding protein [Hyphomonadaceae bacterium]|nr:ATP-binding protein [Hyphomonadaceae bacterium]
MPRTDLVLELVRAGAAGDTPRVKSTAQRMIAEEKANKRGGVAAKILKALDAGAAASAASPATTPSPAATSSVSAPPARAMPRATSFSPSPRGGEAIPNAPAVAERTARRRLDTVRLPQEVIPLVRSLIGEQSRGNELRANGLEPRNRLLLVGPPGNGKTSLAEAIAAELGRLFLVVRYDGLIASYLGETASRLRRVFEIAQSMPCVLFFDEMDAIAKERGDANETGEIKRVLTSLLTQIDELPATCLLIAATNHPQMLDEAVWRRFQIRLELPTPSDADIQAYFKDAIAPAGRMPAAGIKQLLQALGQASYSDAEELALSVRRRVVLEGKKKTLTEIADEARNEWLLRSGPSRNLTANVATSPSTPSGARRRRPLEE